MANNNRQREHYKARLKRRRNEAKRFVARCDATNREEAAKGLPITDFRREILAFTEVRLSRDI
jgi:hypothetical protein